MKYQSCAEDVGGKVALQLLHVYLSFSECFLISFRNFDRFTVVGKQLITSVLALNLEGVHDVKLHHPSSSVATSNQ